MKATKQINFLSELDESEDFTSFKAICNIIKEICYSTKNSFIEKTIPKLLKYLDSYPNDLEYLLLFIDYYHVITTIDDSIITKSIFEILSHFPEKQKEICLFLDLKVPLFYKICKEFEAIPIDIIDSDKNIVPIQQNPLNNKENKLLNIVINDENDSFIEYFSNKQKVVYNRIEFEIQKLKPWIVIIEDYITLFNLSIFYGSIQILKYLMMNGNSPDSSSHKYSIFSGNFEIIRLLVQSGVKYDLCFFDTIRFHHYEISDWVLLNYECEEVSFEKCLSTYNIKASLYILLNDNNNFDHYNESPFILSIMHSNIELVKFIFSKYKCQLNDKNEKGYSPLHLACLNGSLPIVKYLIEDLHADIYARGPMSETILHIASQNGHLHIVQYLIETYGFDFTLKNEIGHNSIDVAYFSNQTKVVEYLKVLCITPYKPNCFYYYITF